MPSYNLTIDDASPFIVYSQGWIDSDQNDPSHMLYANNTFHATPVQGATASFSFNGTGVYLYGSKRFNHDQYSVVVDGNIFRANGSASPDIFQQLLYANDSLPYGEHQVILANDYVRQSAFVDLDYVVITTGDNKTATVAQDITLDDSSSNFTYVGLWDNTPNSLSVQYANQTMHRTNTPNAQASLTFQGNGVSIYGATSDNHGAFSVALDGGEPVVASGSSSAFRPQTLLYELDGLSDGNHTLTITNLGQDNNTFFDLDQAIVHQYVRPGAVAASGASVSISPIATLPASNLNMSGTLSSSDSGAIAGIVVGIVLIILLGMLALALCLRRRMRRTQSATDRRVKLAEAGENLDDIPPQQLVINPFRDPSLFENPPYDPTYALEMPPPPHYDQVVRSPVTGSAGPEGMRIEPSLSARLPEKDPRLFALREESSPEGEAPGPSSSQA